MSTLTTCPPDGESDDEDEDKEERKTWRENYTLSQIQHNRPQDVQRVAELIARGIPKHAIAKACKMHYYTVSEIELQLFPEIAQRREHAKDKAFVALTASLDSAIDRGHKGLATAVDAKLLSETFLNLAGEATQTIQHIHDFPALQEFGQLANARTVEAIED